EHEEPIEEGGNDSRSDRSGGFRDILRRWSLRSERPRAGSAAQPRSVPPDTVGRPIPDGVPRGGDGRDLGIQEQVGAARDREPRLLEGEPVDAAHRYDTRRLRRGTRGSLQHPPDGPSDGRAHPDSRAVDIRCGVPDRPEVRQAGGGSPPRCLPLSVLYSRREAGGLRPLPDSRWFRADEEPERDS